MHSKFDNISEGIKKKCISEVITRVEEIEGPSVGIIAAQEIIDIVTQNIGPEIYNLALRNAKKLFQEKFTDISYDIDQLEQS